MRVIYNRSNVFKGLYLFIGLIMVVTHTRSRSTIICITTNQGPVVQSNASLTTSLTRLFIGLIMVVTHTRSRSTIMCITTNQGPVVQSNASLTTSLTRQLVK